MRAVELPQRRPGRQVPCEQSGHGPYGGGRVGGKISLGVARNSGGELN